MKRIDNTRSYKSEITNTFQKCHIYIVVGWNTLGIGLPERAFSDYFDAERYIDTQEDDLIYTIEKVIYQERTLPF